MVSEVGAMQSLVATAEHVGKVRKPLAIICVGIVLHVVWRAVVDPALIGGPGRYEPI